MLPGHNSVHVILFSPLSEIEEIAVSSLIYFPGKVKNVEVVYQNAHQLSSETGLRVTSSGVFCFL